jgi:hypothetical protein
MQPLPDGRGSVPVGAATVRERLYQTSFLREPS